jgi:hypothetical protein
MRGIRQAGAVVLGRERDRGGRVDRLLGAARSQVLACPRAPRPPAEVDRDADAAVALCSIASAWPLRTVTVRPKPSTRRNRKVSLRASRARNAREIAQLF